MLAAWLLSGLGIFAAVLCAVRQPGLVSPPAWSNSRQDGWDRSREKFLNLQPDPSTMQNQAEHLQEVGSCAAPLPVRR